MKNRAIPELFREEELCQNDVVCDLEYVSKRRLSKTMPLSFNETSSF